VSSIQACNQGGLDAARYSWTTRYFSRITDKTSFDSKFKDNSWRSRTSGNLMYNYYYECAAWIGWGLFTAVCSQQQWGSGTSCTGADTGGMHPPTRPKECWHDTWFHWKSSPKIFLYGTLLAKDAKNQPMLTISQKRFFVSLDELALFMEPEIK